jgi:hypothetical protein
MERLYLCRYYRVFSTVKLEFEAYPGLTPFSIRGHLCGKTVDPGPVKE